MPKTEVAPTPFIKSNNYSKTVKNYGNLADIGINNCDMLDIDLRKLITTETRKNYKKNKNLPKSGLSPIDTKADRRV